MLDSIFGSLAAGALGLAGSIFGASAEKKAAKKNANAQSEINRTQLEFARELRGEGGKPVFLPLYSGNREQELFDVADSLFTKAAPSASRGSEVEAITQPFEASFNSAVSDARNGNLTNRKLANSSGVRSARTKGANARLDAINQSLDEVLSQQNAQASQKGFSGGGSFRNNRALQSTLNARQEAANTLTAAELANAIGEASIRNEGEDLAFQLGIQSPDLAQAALGLDRAPTTVPIQEYLDALQVLAPFNTSQNTNAAANLVGGLQAPQFQGVSTAGNALGFTSGALGNIFAAKQQQDNFDKLLEQAGV